MSYGTQNLVTTIPDSNTNLNNPWTGESSIDAPEVQIPLNLIPGVGNNGKNLEIKFEWTDGSNTYQRYFKGFNLEESFNLNKQTGDLSTVVIQTKTSESESYQVYTLTPYGSPDFKWSFNENSEQSFVLSNSDSTENNLAGILINKDDTTLGPFSSSWSNLKVYVKLYNGDAYPGFVEDEQNWTSFNSWDLEINPNSALSNSISSATTQAESLTVASYITNDYLNPQNLNVFNLNNLI